jgi:hypothetical protein
MKRKQQRLSYVYSRLCGIAFGINKTNLNQNRFLAHCNDIDYSKNALFIFCFSSSSIRLSSLLLQKASFQNNLRF